MKPIEFKGFNVTYAKNQPEYQPLPAFKDTDGLVVSCWKLTLIERIKLLFIGRLWIAQATFHQNLQPQFPCVKKLVKITEVK